MQQQGRTDADRQTRHRGDEGLFEFGEAVEKAEPLHLVARKPTCRDNREIHEIVTGGERVARAGDEHAADGLVVSSPLQSLHQSAIHGIGDGVLFPGPVDGEGENRTGLALQNFGHAGSLEGYIWGLAHFGEIAIDFWRAAVTPRDIPDGKIRGPFYSAAFALGGARIRAGARARSAADRPAGTQGVPLQQNRVYLDVPLVCFGLPPTMTDCDNSARVRAPLLSGSIRSNSSPMNCKNSAFDT